MGVIQVRVGLEETESQAMVEGVRGSIRRAKGDEKGISGLIPMRTEDLAASLRGLTCELGKLFGDIRRVGGFELNEVQVGLEISAEGGFNLIGNAKAGGKGGITLTFAPGKTDVG